MEKKKYLTNIEEVKKLPDGTHLHLTCSKQDKNDCIKHRDGILIPFEWFDRIFIEGVSIYKKVAAEPESRRDGMR